MLPVRERVIALIKTVLKPRRSVFLALAGVGLVSLGVWGVMRTQLTLKPALAARDAVRVKGDIKVAFGQEVAAGMKATIEPEVTGVWREHRNVLGVSALTFVPVKRFQAGQSYKLHITNIKRVVTGSPVPDVVETFQTQTPPSVKSFEPAPGAKSVPVKPRLSITLSAANRDVRNLKATLTPEVTLHQVEGDDTTFTWEPVTPLKQGTAYTFAVEDTMMPTPELKRLVTSPFSTVSAPIITEARTGGYLSPGQHIDITFDQAMAPVQDSFSFDMKGAGSWINDRTYRFVPTSLEPGKTYGYRVRAGIASATGGLMEAERAFTVSTNGAVGASVSPGGGGVSVGTTIRIAFDQEVDHASAQARFSTSPVTTGAFSWSGNTMVYKPASLAYQSSYSYSVAPGVVPKWGLPSAKVLGSSFGTESQVIKLGVPIYKQAYGRSCELASLRMLLAFRGIKVTDYDLLQRVGYAPRARDTGSNSWENPNTQFVGFVDTFSWAQGYGVHAGPIATAAQSYGRSATAYFGVSAAFISTSIHEGNPVEFWGHISDAHADSWNTTSGVVQTTTSMHGRVVYGVVGSPSDPTGFYINDPWTATSFYWSAAQLMANMDAVPGVSNQAVIVR